MPHRGRSPSHGRDAAPIGEPGGTLGSRRRALPLGARWWSGGVRHELRPDIQALRGIAVALVVVGHLWPGALRGGFVGVDVFFAISGFLITGHLLRELERDGRVSLRGFWA